jgi:branched-chain amino acid transport system permease protein
MQIIASILIDSLSYAMVLFMISIGMSMTMGLMRVVNMAHGAFAMMGGFLAAAAPAFLHIPFELGVLIAIAAVALASLPMEAVLIRRVYHRPPLDQMLMTLGVMYIFIAAADVMFGSMTTAVNFPSYLSGSANLGFRSMPRDRLYVIGIGLTVALLIWLGIERSSFGIRVRAAVDNPAIAQAVGIDTARIYAITFAIGAGLAALGGIAGSQMLPMESTYASKYLVIILAVVAVGGHQSLIGTLAAALLLGFIDTATKYLAPSFSSIAFYITMFVVLMVRPGGLIGHGSR